MGVRREYWAEWCDEGAWIAAARRAIQKASKDGIAMGNPPLDIEEELRQGIGDWAEPGDYCVSRKFPNLGMALGWAKKNAKHVGWECIGVHVNEVSDDIYETTETVESWEVVFGGEPYRTD